MIESGANIKIDGGRTSAERFCTERPGENRKNRKKEGMRIII